MSKRDGRKKVDIVLDCETFIKGVDLAKHFKECQGYSELFKDRLSHSYTTRPYIVGVYILQDNDYRFFTKLSELIKFLNEISKDAKTLHIWGHNISYDIITIANALLEEGTDLKYDYGKTSKGWLREGRLSIPGIFKTIYLHDTLNYFGASLSLLDKTKIVYTKTDVEWNEDKEGWDFTNFETGKRCFESLKECIEYLKNDLDLTTQVIKDYKEHIREYITIYPNIQKLKGTPSTNTVIKTIGGYLWKGKEGERLDIIFSRAFKRPISALQYELEKGSNFGGCQLRNTLIKKIHLKNSIHKIDVNSFYAWIVTQGIPHGIYTSDKAKTFLETETDTTCKFFRVIYKGFNTTHKALSETNQTYLNQAIKKITDNGGSKEILLLEELYNVLNEVGEFIDLEILETRTYKLTKKLNPLVEFLYKRRKRPNSEVDKFNCKYSLLKIYGLLGEKTYQDDQRTNNEGEGGKPERYTTARPNTDYKSVIGGVYISQKGTAKIIKDVLNLSKCKDFRLLHCHTDSITFITTDKDWKKRVDISEKLGHYKIEIEKASHYLSPSFNRHLIYKNEDEYICAFSSQIPSKTFLNFEANATPEDLFTFFEPKNNIRAQINQNVKSLVDGGVIITKKYEFTRTKELPPTHILDEDLKIKKYE